MRRLRNDKYSLTKRLFCKHFCTLIVELFGLITAHTKFVLVNGQTYSRGQTKEKIFLPRQKKHLILFTTKFPKHVAHHSVPLYHIT